MNTNNSTLPETLNRGGITQAGGACAKPQTPEAPAASLPWTLAHDGLGYEGHGAGAIKVLVGFVRALSGSSLEPEAERLTGTLRADVRKLLHQSEHWRQYVTLRRRLAEADVAIERLDVEHQEAQLTLRKLPLDTALSGAALAGAMAKADETVRDAEQRLTQLQRGRDLLASELDAVRGHVERDLDFIANQTLNATTAKVRRKAEAIAERLVAVAGPVLEGWYAHTLALQMLGRTVYQQRAIAGLLDEAETAK